jgi:hypothetical protein
MTRLSRLAAALFAVTLASPTAQAQDPDRVTMTLREFLQLYEASKDRPKPPPVAPVAYTIASSRYDGEVRLRDGEPSSAVFEARFHVDLHQDEGWTRVRLLPGSVALSSARLDGREAAVELREGWYTLLTDKTGRLDVDVVFATQIATSKGSSSLSFQLPSAGATELSLGVPSEHDLDFDVANARLIEDTTDGDTRTVTATVPSAGLLAIAWQRELPDAVDPTDPDQAGEQPRVYAEVHTLAGLGDGLLSATTTITHSILFAGVETLSARIPEGFTLLDVAGNGVRDWSLADDGTLSVQLNYAAEGIYPLSLQLEKVVGEGDVITEAPVVVPLAVERSKGWLGVESRGSLEIAAGDVTGATSVDVRSLPGSILGITGNPVLLGYKYLGDGAVIPLQVTQHDDVDVLVTLLDQTRARTMWTGDGRSLTSVTYQVRNNRKQFLRLALPEGAELWSASVGGRAVQPAQSADGRVLVPLVRSQAAGGTLAAFSVEVVYVQDHEPAVKGKGSYRGSLPAADVPSTYVAWSVYVPDGAKVKSADGSLHEVDTLSNPIPGAGVYEIQTANAQVQRSAGDQAMGGGAVPVAVSLPLQGTPLHFEKLLAMDEELWVGFSVKGL